MYTMILCITTVLRYTVYTVHSTYGTTVYYSLLVVSYINISYIVVYSILVYYILTWYSTVRVLDSRRVAIVP